MTINVYLTGLDKSVKEVSDAAEVDYILAKYNKELIHMTQKEYFASVE